MTIHDTKWRTENAGRLLFTAGDRFISELIEFVRFHGFPAVSEALLTVFQNLDDDGTWLTTMASRAGLTAQSMMELIDKAEALDFVERRSDPVDKRAKIVMLAATGRLAREQVRAGVEAVEGRVRSAMGADFLADAKERLLTYAATMPSTLTTEIRTAPSEAAWRMRNAARVFRTAQMAFAADLLRVARQEGADRVTPVQLALYRHLDLSGTRLTEIAARAHMTKSAMLEVVRKALTLGFVERRPDPSDGRAKFIHFTQSGLRMLEQLHIGVTEAERRMGTVLGVDFLDEMKTRLRVYVIADGVARMVDEEKAVMAIKARRQRAA